MLIRTIKELDEAHASDAILIDDLLLKWQPCGHVIDAPETKLWHCIGGELASEELLAQTERLTLIYPRRYGDEDVAALRLELHKTLLTGGVAVPHVLAVGQNAYDQILDNLARAALDALETGNILPDTATVPHTTAHKGTNQQKTAEEGNDDH